MILVVDETKTKYVLHSYELVLEFLELCVTFATHKIYLPYLYPISDGSYCRIVPVIGLIIKLLSIFKKIQIDWSSN